MLGVAAIVAALALLTSCLFKPGNAGTTSIRFDIDVSLDQHAISPLIYGLNTNDAATLASTRTTLLRMGGNRWTAYNWENNASNAGSDWCFQNDGLLSSSNTPGAAVQPTITQARNAGAAALVTVPIVDYVAADKNGGCDVRSSGANYLTTRFEQNKSTKPSALSLTPNATDGVVYEDEYVNWLKQAVPGANVVFSLDNEPDLWSSTHAEVHPNPVTYTELANRNIDFAGAVKRVWPTAKVTGPVNYGFNGFENLQNAPDASGKGTFLDWYLDRIKAASTTAGVRLVDDLDLHWYPEATGGGVRITGTDTTAAVVAAREQAPRSLWDPTYVESSWITNDYGYGAIRLLPRTKDRIAAHYPGTGIALTEWNYGGGGHISGAIACSDVLGIFGREGVDVASYWPLQSNESYAYGAFAAFRNYDGAGGPLRRHLGASHDQRHGRLERLCRDRRGEPQPSRDRGHQQGHHGHDDIGQHHRRAEVRPRQDLHVDRSLADPAGRGHAHQRGPERVPLHDAGPVGDCDRSGHLERADRHSRLLRVRKVYAPPLGVATDRY